MTSITVVIPVKDDAVMLSACLRSLSSQTRPPDEVIVVDNDSADDSGAVARRWGATVLFEPEPGIGAAAATGYDAATGDLIARCDADSILGQDWLERIERQLAARLDAVAISGPGRFYDMPPILRSLADLLYMRAYFVAMHAALANRAIFGSNFAIRAAVWNRISGTVHRHDADVHDDVDLAYHLEPGSTVLFDRSITVGISARPFSDLGSMALRLRRAQHTIAVHGVWDSPPSRWVRLVSVSVVRSARARRRAVIGRALREQQVP